MLRKKKSLAFVLALVMMLTLIPASAFASTENKAQSIPTVATETDMPTSTINMVVKDAAGIASGAEQHVKITLVNGTWSQDTVTAGNIVTTGAIAAGVNKATGPSIAIKESGGATGIDINDYTSANDSSAEFVFSPTGGALALNEYLSFDLNVEAGSDAGDVQAIIEVYGTTQVSPGTYTIGVAAGTSSVAKVAKDPVNVGRGVADTAGIEIREVAVGSVYGQQSIKLSLPKGFTWNSDMIANAGSYISGSMVSGSALAVAQPSGSDIVVNFDTKGNPNAQEVLVINPRINVGSDANFGDVNVQIREVNTNTGTISEASDLLVAKYGDFGVTVTTVKEADIPTIIAGRELKDGSRAYEVKVILEETIDGSLIDGRYVDFIFSDKIQLATGAGIKYKVNGTTGTTSNLTPEKANIEKDTSKFSWAVGQLAGSGKKDKIEFTIPVTVDAQYTGDIELTVSGTKAGFDEQKVVVGKAVAPVTVSTSATSIRTGVQNQKVADITIKETEKGAIRDASGTQTLTLAIDTDTVNNMKFAGKVKAEVKSGDLSIKSTKVNSSGVVEILIDRTSLKTPAEILVSGLELSLNRSPAEGPYDLLVGGDAIVNNEKYLNYSNNDGDFEDSSVVTPYINVVTPADSGVNATFVIGQQSYVSNGVNHTMDAASYIDSANRTMVPIRYVANAMGVSEDQVVWNQATQTATIFGKNIVSIKVGSNTITSNGTPITMDTVAVNNAGRIYVPIRYVSNALGANVAWDQATQTATIFTVK